MPPRRLHDGCVAKSVFVVAEPDSKALGQISVLAKAGELQAVEPAAIPRIPGRNTTVATTLSSMVVVQKASIGPEPSALSNPMLAGAKSPAGNFWMTAMTLKTLAALPTPWIVTGPARPLVSRFRRFLERADKRRQMKMLLRSDDRILDDIGVSRSELMASLSLRP